METNLCLVPSQDLANADDLALREHADVIRVLGKRVVADAIEIGRRLVDCRDNLLEHGQWLPWLEREFGWSRQTADNLIHVYEGVAQNKLPNFGNLNLPMTAFYTIFAPSTPQEARDEISERAEAGEKLPVAEIKRVIAASKASAKSNDRDEDGGRDHDGGPWRALDEALGEHEIVPRAVKQAAKRVEAFLNSMAFVLTGCKATTEIKVPHLDTTQRSRVLLDIDEAIVSLRALRHRLDDSNTEGARLEELEAEAVRLRREVGDLQDEILRLEGELADKGEADRRVHPLDAGANKIAENCRKIRPLLDHPQQHVEAIRKLNAEILHAVEPATKGKPVAVLRDKLDTTALGRALSVSGTNDAAPVAAEMPDIPEFHIREH